MKFLRANFVLYPFLFGLYPVFSLIASNASEMDFPDGLRSIAGSLVITLIIYFIFLLLIKNPAKAALLSSILILLFFSYGHINLLGRSWTFLDLSLGRHRFLLPVYLLLFLLASWLVLRTKRDLSMSTRILNAFALILLFMPLIQVAISQVEHYRARLLLGEENNGMSRVSISPDGQRPDIYYIVLDGYPRGDFINQYLDSSNLDFLTSLEELGFYVAHCSQSNYSDTRFSLASTLNMTYLDGGQNLPEVVHTGAVLDSMIHTGEVQQNLSDLGYTIITFESGYKWLRWELTDHHLIPEQFNTSRFSYLGINDFEQLFLDTTAARLLLDLPLLLDSDRLAGIIDNPRAVHRERVMFSLEQLQQVPVAYPSPKFTYAHIIFPHPPFIVDSPGQSLQNTPRDELSAYADQITYLNQRLLDIFNSLLEHSDPAPIIILQGDHGATIAYTEQEIDPAQRLGILNAYHLPPNASGNEPSKALYPNISPVNSFRLIFDSYFKAGYGLLKDNSILGRQSPYILLDCTPPK